MLQKAIGDSVLSKTRVQEWYKDFKSGCTVIKDFLSSGRSSIVNDKENVEKVKEIMHENCHISLRELASELNTAYGTAHSVA